MGIDSVKPLTFETKANVLVFDLVKQAFTTDFPSLCQARQSCAVFYYGMTINAVSGSTAEMEQLSTCKSFYVRLNKWEEKKKIPFRPPCAHCQIKITKFSAKNTLYQKGLPFEP